MPLHIVAARVGDEPETILATYAHLLPRSDAVAAEAVSALLVDEPLTNSTVYNGEHGYVEPISPLSA